jgi:DNA repair protein RadC
MKLVPERLRPREMMDRLGAEGVGDDVLIAVLLRGGVRGANALDLARKVLAMHNGSLADLARAEVSELAGIKGIGRVKAQILKAATEIAARLRDETVPPGVPVKCPADAARVLNSRARLLDREVFWVLPLDRKNRLKRPPVEVTSGLLDASLVHPREVFQHAIRTSSAAVVLAHNHPSGDPTPSAEDLRITRQLIDAGRIVDIRVLDHVIIGSDGGGENRPFLSLREEGVVSFE